MPTISSTTTLTLAAGQAYVFLAGSGVGIAVADPGGRSAKYSIGPQQTAIGPFSTSVSVDVLITSGSIEYRVDTDGDLRDQDPAIAAQAAAIAAVEGRALQIDQSAGLQIAGAALTPAQAGVVRGHIGASAPRRTAVIIGDSIIYNGSNSTNTYRNSRSVVQHALRKLGRPVCVLNEAGYPGETTRQLFARYDQIVSPYDPDIVFLESGTNDLSVYSAAVAYADIVDFHDRVVSEGRRFVYIGQPPLVFGAQAPILHNLLRRKELMTPTFEYARGWEKLIDYNVSTAGLAVPTLVSNALPDGVHPGAYGARLWGDGLADDLKLRGFEPHPVFSAFGSSGTAGDFVENLVIGGLVGSAGTGITASVTPIGSRVVETSTTPMGNTGLQKLLPGRLHQSVWSPGISPSNSDTMLISVDSNYDGNGGVYAGKKLVGRCYATASATGGLIRGIAFYTSVMTWAYSNIVSSVDNRCFDPSSTLYWSLNASEYEGYFELLPFTIPETWSTPNQLRVQSRIILFADPGATVTLRCGCFELTSTD